MCKFNLIQIQIHNAKSRYISKFIPLFFFFKQRPVRDLVWLLNLASDTVVVIYSVCMRCIICSSIALAWTNHSGLVFWTTCWRLFPKSVERMVPPAAHFLFLPRLHSLRWLFLHFNPVLFNYTPLPLLRVPPHPAAPTALQESSCKERGLTWGPPHPNHPPPNL